MMDMISKYFRHISYIRRLSKFFRRLELELCFLQNGKNFNKFIQHCQFKNIGFINSFF